MIAHEETARLGTPGFADGISSGYSIGLPPVFNFGPKHLKERVVPEVLLGQKRICLAITEVWIDLFVTVVPCYYSHNVQPYAGSDVARLRTTAKRTPDGKHFIVNGVKKWITNGTFADYFSVAVRTEKGITMLFIERGEGLDTKGIKTSYSSAAGTSYITFENVKVPVENILGEEGKGFQVIMYKYVSRQLWYDSN